MNSTTLHQELSTLINNSIATWTSILARIQFDYIDSLGLVIAENRSFNERISQVVERHVTNQRDRAILNVYMEHVMSSYRLIDDNLQQVIVGVVPVDALSQYVIRRINALNECLILVQ